MKRLLCLILTIATTLSMLPAASTATVISGAKVSGDYEYKINSDKKTVTIVYCNGNFEKTAQVPSKVDGKTVTEIAWGAFGNLGMLENVSIPDSVKTIADEAFLNCTGLTTVSIGTGVKNLPGNPFDGCISLSTIKVASNHKYLTVRDGVLFLKNGMKLRCYPAAKRGISYTIPDGVTEIGDSAFSGNNELKTLVIPASVTSIHEDAFNDGYGHKLNITLDVTNNSYAKSYAVEAGIDYAENKPIKICNEYKYILLEDYTAQIVGYNGKETDITFPEKLDGVTVTSIGDMWLNSNTVSIGIPDCVTSVGKIFTNCSDLKIIRVSQTHPTLATIDGVLFDKKQKTLLCYPRGLSQLEYTIPQGILSIGNYAFYSASIAKINIPTSVTSIGDHAFHGCIMSSINIPNSVTSIGDHAFYHCQRVDSFNIPDSVTSIGDFAFSYCGSQRNSITVTITIPESVIDFGTGVFAKSNARIKVSHVHPILEVIDDVLFDKNNKALLYCPPWKSGSYTIPDHITLIGDSAFFDCSLTSINIPDSVTSIGDSAFSDCSLASINIPNSVTSIGDLAFHDCSMRSINIPNSVTSIGQSAFNGCYYLTSINIPNSVTSIGDYAFYGCESLSAIVEAGSCAERYCKDNKIPYSYPSSLDWLSD